jgi:hypothetical protein
MTASNLRPNDMDKLGEALINLAQELWVVKDRQRILEAALADAGIFAAETIDKFQPDAALTSQLEEERRRFIDALIESLVRPSGNQRTRNPG